jgi:hypothetical protein
MEGNVPNQRSMRGFKEDELNSSPSAPGQTCQRDFHPRVHAPAKQPPATVTPRFP